MNSLKITDHNISNRRIGDSITFDLNGVTYTFVRTANDYFNFRDEEIYSQFSAVTGPNNGVYSAILFYLQINVHHNLKGAKRGEDTYTISSRNGDVFSNVSVNAYNDNFSAELVDTPIVEDIPYVNPNDVLVFNSENGTSFDGGFSLTINGSKFVFEFTEAQEMVTGSFKIPFQYWLNRFNRGVGSAVLLHIKEFGVVNETFVRPYFINNFLSNGDRIIALEAEHPFEIAEIEVFGNNPINIYAIKPNGTTVPAIPLGEVPGPLGLQGERPVDVGQSGDISLGNTEGEQQQLGNVKYRIFAGATGKSIGLDVRKPIISDELFVASSTEIKASSRDRKASETNN